MLVIIIYILFLLILSGICFATNKLSLAIFDNIWLIVIFMCRNELCQENYTQTLFLLVLMNTMVNIGFWIGNINCRFVINKKRKEIMNRQFSPNLIVIILSITFVIFLYYAIQSIMKFGFDLMIVRSANNSDSSEKVFSSILDTIAFYGIGMPSVYVGALVCAYNFSQNVKTPRKIYCLLVVSVVLYIFTAGGRSLLLRIVCFFVAAIIWRLKMLGRFPIKWLKYFLLAIVALLVIMEVITSSRNAVDISFLSQATAYIRGSVSHMNYQLEQMPEDGYFFGYVTYGGFFYYLVKILAMISGSDLKTSNDIMSFLQNYNYIQVGDDISYFNALVPNVFYYYYDSGYLGVVIFSIFLGFAAARGERAYKYPSFLTFVLWATAVYAIVYSPLGGVLWAFRYPMAVIYCCMLKNILYRRVEDNGTLD